MTKNTDEKRSESQAKPPQRIDAPRVRRSLGVSQDVAQEATLPAPSVPKFTAQVMGPLISTGPHAPSTSPTRYSDGVIVSADRQKAHLPSGWWPQHVAIVAEGRHIGCAHGAAIANGDASLIAGAHLIEIPLLACDVCRPRIVVGGPR